MNSQTLEPALDLFFSRCRELQAGAVAGDQPGHGILGAMDAGGKPTARDRGRRGTGSNSLMGKGNPCPRARGRGLRRRQRRAQVIPGGE